MTSQNSRRDERALVRLLSELERRVKSLETSPRAGHTSISNGKLLVMDPATGNVIASLAGASGTDAYGNAFPTGLGANVGSVNGGIVQPGTIDATKVSFVARDISGVTTTTSATAPVSPVLGDLWIDTANGNLLKRWDGTAWAALPVGTNAIQAGAVTASQIAANTISAGNIAAGAITAAAIAAGAVTTGKVSAGTITSTEIAANTIQAGNISAGAITSTAIAANTITAGNIATGAITATAIAANAIVSGKIAAGAIDAMTITGATIITDSATGGVFIYSGTPAAGNLIVSIAAAQGTDAYTNNYPQGINVTQGTISGSTITGSTITAGSLSAGSIGNSTIVGSDFQGGTMENADITFDSNGGTLLVYASTTSTSTFTTSGSFTVPAGVTSLKVECWGAGGGGEGGYTNAGGQGGGGGGYAKVNALTVIPGNSYSYLIGAGGAGGTTVAYGNGGGDSSFSSTSCVAKGGRSYDGTTAPQGGGMFGGNIGDLQFAGGWGGFPNSTGGAGGAGSAGPNSSGHDAPDNNGTGSGTGGTAVTGGGAGGAGGAAGTHNGSAGTTPGGGGGGGGGGSSPGAGGAGARGQVKVTYTTARSLVCSIASTAGTDAYGNSYPVGIYAPSPTFARKTANSTMTSSTTFTDDAHLSVAVAANATYTMTAVLKYEAGTTGDISTQWLGPTGAAVVGSVVALVTTAAADTDNYITGYALSEVHAAGGRGAGNPRAMQFTGCLTTGATVGTLKLQWAQFATDTVSTIMYAGSYLQLQRIA